MDQVDDNGAVSMEGGFQSECLRLALLLGKQGQAYERSIEKLIALHEKQTDREFSASFADDMAKAQAEMKPIIADEKNTQNNTTYSSLAAIDEGIRKVYTKYGFAPTFGTLINPQDDDHVSMYLDLMHRSGHSKRYELRLPADGKSAHGKVILTRTHAAGSAFSYAQRYLIKQAFNVVTVDRDDDDGTAAGAITITEEQLGTLAGMIQLVGADVDKFKKYFNVKELSDLPRERYDEAIGALNLKGSKNEG